MRRFFLVFLLFAFAIPHLCWSSQTKIKPEELPPIFKKWLEEEVVYIISSKEKDVFLQLETDRERKIFIDAFWRIRDPNPSTPENEFKTEHYSRIAYANKMFGRDTPAIGWRTEMGRIYIILGEPNSIEKYENETEVRPTIIWFYQGKIELGLPNSFNVVFFRQEEFSDWEIYSPIVHGPYKLLRFFSNDRINIEAAYKQLYQFNPSVAKVSMSLIPHDQTSLTSPSMASDILISRIFETPKKVEDEYAEKLLKYKDIIEVEYTANYIGNDSFVQTIQDEQGMFFVHYLIEPKRLSLELYEGSYHTTLEISGQVTDLEGKTIFQFDKSLPLQFNRNQFDQIKSKLFSYQNAFPLVEGTYKFLLLMKNKVSREFTSFEKQLLIPSTAKFQMSPLLLAHSKKQSPYVGQIKPFKVQDQQVYISPKKDFSKEENLHVYFELYGVPEGIRTDGKVKVTISKSDEVIQEQVREGTQWPQYDKFLISFPLTDMSPANYGIRVSVQNRDGKEVLFEQEFFYISHRLSLPRPFISTELLAPADNAVYDYILGGQHFNKGQIQTAKTLLERAYRKEPNNFKYALGFAQVLFQLQRHQEVLDILTPFVQGTEPQHAAYSLLGKSFQTLGQYPQAIESFQAYLSHFGTNLRVLNDLGECHFQLGNREDALVAWKKSLELDPNQKEIQEKVNTLEGKKE
ncbi:MAG: GWxTD domain-containing protein [Candidatus Aminicenantaceae bacterium]